jgi:hypothetical protein
MIFLLHYDYCRKSKKTKAYKILFLVFFIMLCEGWLPLTGLPSGLHPLPPAGCAEPAACAAGQ